MAVRKYHREQVLHILDSFSEAVKEAKKLQQKGQAAPVINLLADIQEAADFLDTFIKERDVDVTKTTIALTALNEGLYYASEDVNGGTAASNTFNYLLKLIYDVQKSVKEELKINKIEVVFMPYNASMWDSLESVYLSMAADDFCDAYVVPLPWNKLNEHQGIAERCYEGDQFPKDIPVTHYNDYDLESRHPEIIFIHNTYDEYNLVTRVDERFYTRNLKANCDKLVFIPYYGKLAGDLRHFEHFFHPVLFQNCDLVVAATEEEREFALEIKKKHKSNAKYEVAALGTPKYDRLFEYEQKAKDGTLEIPDDWREKIFKTEGMKKKVIFYNTSLAAMLAVEEEHPQTPGNEPGLKYLAKVESVLEVFKQRDDVVLLWRPHPLMLSTMQSMRPHLLNRWIKIVSDFKKEGCGIYDESSDLHRAIAVSDAYYGDESSVANLFTVVHPNKECVYLQNASSMGLANISPYICPAMFVYDDSLYFKEYFNNNIYKVDRNNGGGVKYLASIPSKPTYKQRQHVSAVIKEDMAYFLPCNDNSIVTYDLKTEKFEQFDLEIEHRLYNPWDMENNFRNGFVYKDKLVLIPAYYNAIVYYNFETRDTVHSLDLTDILSEIGYGKDKICFFNYEFLSENVILLPFIYSNKVLEFNLDTYEYKLHTVGDCNETYSIIKKFQNKFYLVGWNTPVVYCWNYETNEICMLSAFPKDISKSAKKVLFGTQDICLIENYLYCFATYANMSVRIELPSGQAERLTALDSYCDGKENTGVFHSSVVNREKVYLAEYEANKIIEYNTETQTVRELLFSATDCLDQEAIIALSNETIDEMINGENQTVLVKDSKTCGMKIFDYVKKLI